MVDIKTVRASNAQLQTSHTSQSLTAVFVGATSGIGLATLKAFAQSVKLPTVYICGRSIQSFRKHLDDLRESNSEGNFVFLETEVSLMKEVDRVCAEIQAKEEKVDLLWLSCGVLKLGSRDETVEGLHMPLSLAYFARLRFVHDLLPLLNRSSYPRVVSILGGGLEKEIDINDIEVKTDFGAMKAAEIATTLNTLAFQALSKANPKISFIHKYPGFVNTGSISRLLATFTGAAAIFAALVEYTFVPLANFFATTVAEAGERGLYLLTSARYPPPSAITDGLASASEREIDGRNEAEAKSGNGVYRLGAADDTVAESAVLERYRSEGIDEKVWRETQAVWNKIERARIY